MNFDKILLSHGSGGKISHQLIKEILLPELQNTYLSQMDDGAILPIKSDKLVFTTDSYVVDPIFFPGGDIGKLAVSGTVNDLAVMGAVPHFLSLAFILEEGLPVKEFEKILNSIRRTCELANVRIVTGDTKVVQKGALDKIFINTSGIGELTGDFGLTGELKKGDKIIINGTIGDHGTTIMAGREGLEMKSNLQSDCSPLNSLISSLFDFNGFIRLMRDPTRGGLATTLNEWIENSNMGLEIFETALPIRPEVKALCEILGLDPIYIANEGKVVLIVDAAVADNVLRRLQMHELGKDSAIIGEVTDTHPGKVTLETALGSRRIIDMLSGEQLPRIC